MSLSFLPNCEVVPEEIAAPSVISSDSLLFSLESLIKTELIFDNMVFDGKGNFKQAHVKDTDFWVDFSLSHPEKHAQLQKILETEWVAHVAQEGFKFSLQQFLLLMS